MDADIDHEIAMLRAVTDEQRAQADLAARIAQLRKEGASAEKIAALEAAAAWRRSYDEATAALEKSRAAWQSFATELEQTLGQGLSSLITDGITNGFRNAQDIVLSISRQILTQVTNALIQPLIANLVGGLAGGLGGGGGGFGGGGGGGIGGLVQAVIGAAVGGGGGGGLTNAIGGGGAGAFNGSTRFYGLDPTGTYSVYTYAVYNGLDMSLYPGLRARGGSVWPGQPFVVGEEGPEMFVPKSAGTVIPADATRALRRGGTTIVNFNVRTPDAPSFRRSEGQVAADARRRYRS